MKKFTNAAEAEQAEHNNYRSLTGPERMEIFFELLPLGRADDDTVKGFSRVYQIVKRGER